MHRSDEYRLASKVYCASFSCPCPSKFIINAEKLLLRKPFTKHRNTLKLMRFIVIAIKNSTEKIVSQAALCLELFY